MTTTALNTTMYGPGGGSSGTITLGYPTTPAATRAATPLIYKKMAEIMREIGPVTKAQTNSQQGFKFRGIDQFINALHPALVKHAVFMTPRCTSFTKDLKDVVRSSGKAGVDAHVAVLMEYDFYAEDGSKVTVGPVPAEGMDSGDKATNKSLSAALKYALIQTFSVPTEDMEEADRESPLIGKKLTSAPLSAQESKDAAVLAAQDAATAQPAKAEPAKSFSTFRGRKPAETPAPVTKSSGGLNL